MNSSAQVVVPVVSPDMALGMTGAPASIAAGQTVTYTLTVKNSGAVPATGVAVTNTLSANLGFAGVSLPLGASYSASQNSVIFNLGPMSVGQTATVSLAAMALSAGQATNSAIVGDSLADNNPGNNSASVVTTVNRRLGGARQPGGRSGSHRRLHHLEYSLPFHLPGGLWIEHGQQRIVPESNALPTSHMVMLTGLVPDTNYVFQARSITGAVPASDITNGSVVTISEGVPGVLYTSNSTFSTTSSLILGTMDASYSGAVWTIGGPSQATGIFGANYAFCRGSAATATASATYSPNIPVAGPLRSVRLVSCQTRGRDFLRPTPHARHRRDQRVPVNVDQTHQWRRLAAAGHGGVFCHRSHGQSHHQQRHRRHHHQRGGQRRALGL